MSDVHHHFKCEFCSGDSSEGNPVRRFESTLGAMFGHTKCFNDKMERDAIDRIRARENQERLDRFYGKAKAMTQLTPELLERPRRKP